jgi:hypothetical protein
VSDKKITKRGDLFYYIEVWDRQDLRDHSINIIVGEEPTNTTYVNGTQVQLHKTDIIYAALFWKRKVSATFRVSQLLKRPKNKNLKFIVKEMSREEFIETIPDESKLKSTDLLYWNINRSLRKKELEYLEKLKKN